MKPDKTFQRLINDQEYRQKRLKTLHKVNIAIIIIMCMFAVLTVISWFMRYGLEKDNSTLIFTILFLLSHSIRLEINQINLVEYMKDTSSKV